MRVVNTLLISILLSLAPLSLHAQSSKDNQAKAYYFVALEAFEAKQYDEVLASIKNVEDLLGSSNARLSALKVKTYFEQNKHDKAKAELDRFFSYQSSDEQGREMASYLRKIESAKTKLAQEKQEKENQKITNKNQVNSKFDELVKLITAQEFEAYGRVEVDSRDGYRYIDGYRTIGTHVDITQSVITHNEICSFKVIRKISGRNNRDYSPWPDPKTTTTDKELAEISNARLEQFNISSENLEFLNVSLGSSLAYELSDVLFTSEKNADKAKELAHFILTWGDCSKLSSATSLKSEALQRAYGKDTYLGQLKDNKPHGKGKYTWADGDVYEGDFVANELTGLGKFTWPDGLVEEGQFKNGKKVD